MKKLLILLLSAVLLLQVAMAATLYINQSYPTCSNSYTYVQAQTWTTPWCDFTNINNFSNGDTLYICNGTYRQSAAAATIQDKVLTSDTTITAYPGEFPFITAEISNFTYWNRRTDVCTYCYQSNSASATSSNEFWFTSPDGVDRMSYGDGSGGTTGCSWTITDLIDSTHPTGMWHNNSDSRYWIRLPSAVDLNVSSPHIAKSQGPIIDIQNITGTGRLIIKNLNMSYGRYAITLSNDTYTPNNVWIYNNTFNHFFRAVEVTHGTNDTISNNHFYNEPQTDWFWEIYKSDHHLSMHGTACYQMEGDSTKIDKSHGQNLIFANNTIDGNFNGIYLYANESDQEYNTLIYGNSFTNIGDDSIEHEDYGYNNTDYNNTATDCFVGISMAPYNSNLSMTRIFNNSLYCGRWQPYSSLTSGYNGKTIKYERSTGQASNVYLYHNTFLSEPNGTIMRADNGNAHPLANVTTRDNIFYSVGSGSGAYLVSWTGLESDSNRYDYNLWYRTTGYRCQRYNNIAGSTYSSLASCKTAGGATAWDNHSIEGNPELADIATGNYTPAASSPVCGAASDGTDIGAVACEVSAPTGFTITATYPANNTNPSYVNGTIEFTASAIVTCTLNDSRFNRILPVVTPDTTYQFRYDPTFPYTYTDVFPEGHYNVQYRCTDGSVWNNGTIEFTYSHISADSYGYSGDAAVNYGSSSTVAYGIDGGGAYEAFFKVNYTGLPLSINVTSAIAYLTSSGPYISEIKACTDGVWDESTITYASRLADIDQTTCTVLYARDCGGTFTGPINVTAIAQTELYLDRIFTIYINGSDNCWMDTADISSVNSVASTGPYVDFTYETIVTPPVVTQIDYYSQFLNSNITFTTNTPAFCRFASTDLSYTAMTLNASGSSTSHWLNLSTMAIGNNTLYISCNDTFGNYATAADNYNGWFYIISANVQFLFYDESTEALMVPTVYFSIYNLTSTVNASTSNGTYSTNLSLGDYNIVYWAAGYSIRTMPFTSTITPTNLTLYLVNGSTAIVATVYYSDGKPAEGVYIKTMRKLPTGYHLVEISETNYQGKADFYGFTYMPSYYWILTTQNGTVLKTTGETEIYRTEFDFFLDPETVVGETFSKRAGLSYQRPTYNNITNTWTFIYSDSTLTMGNASLIVTDLSGNVIGSDYSTSPADTLTVDMTGLYHNGSTYFATAYVGYSPVMVLDKISYTYPFPGQPNYGATGYFIMFIIVLLVALVAYWNPAVMMVLQAFVLFAGRLLSLHTLNWTWTIGLMALCFVAAYIVRDRA